MFSLFDFDFTFICWFLFANKDIIGNESGK